MFAEAHTKFAKGRSIKRLCSLCSSLCGRCVNFGWKRVEYYSFKSFLFLHFPLMLRHAAHHELHDANFTPAWYGTQRIHEKFG